VIRIDVNVKLRGHHHACEFDGDPRRRYEPLSTLPQDPLNLRLIDEHRHPLPHFHLDGYDGVHLDSRPRHFASSLGKMDIAHREETPVDETGKEERGPGDHLLHVHTAPVLAGWNRSQAAVPGGSCRAAEGCRDCIGRLRGKDESLFSSQLFFPGESSLRLWETQSHAYCAWEALLRDAHAGHVIRRGNEFP